MFGLLCEEWIEEECGWMGPQRVYGEISVIQGRGSHSLNKGGSGRIKRSG